MADDGAIAEFTAITACSPDKARQYLSVTDGNLEQAISLFFSTGGIDLEVPQSNAATSPDPPPVPSDTRRTAGTTSQDVIHVDSDEETVDHGDHSETPGHRPARPNRTVAPAGLVPGQGAPSAEDDEAMARRLQEELYGETGGGSSSVDTEGYRAPIARTRETLVGPDYDLNDPDDRHDAILAQLRAREQARRRGRGGATGIFNQRHEINSIWNESEDGSNDQRRSAMARATGGASEASSKATHLAELFRPPFEIMSQLSWEEARDEGKSEQKWILINVQNNGIFACQALNRDIWKNPEVMATVKECFIFLQYSKDDPRGEQYMQYYFHERDNENLYPHIAIVDPRTGEQVKVWPSGEIPKVSEFLGQLYEFLDRYSLSSSAKNPVAKRKPEPKRTKDVGQMTEEEMMELALKNSLAGAEGSAQDSKPEHFDPDELTRSSNDAGKGKEPESEAEKTDTNGNQATSKFDKIPSNLPHTEAGSAAPNTTRIQFKHPSGRVVRRFFLHEEVQRLYEWLKAQPLDGKEDVPFELISMGTNLIDSLDKTVEEAGLKNGTVMIEFLED